MLFFDVPNVTSYSISLTLLLNILIVLNPCHRPENRGSYTNSMGMIGCGCCYTQVILFYFVKIKSELQSVLKIYDDTFSRFGITITNDKTKTLPYNVQLRKSWHPVP